MVKMAAWNMTRIAGPIGLPGGPRVTLRPIDDPDAPAARWRALERRADGSYFQSWSWIGCWLRCLDRDLRPMLIEATVDRNPVALGVLTFRRARRHGLLVSHGVHLNETGRAREDCLTIEYNGLLVDRRFDRLAITRSCLAWLEAHVPDWDELHLPGVSAGHAEVVSGLPLALRVRDVKPCYGVCLTGPAFAATLSRNTRHHLTRACRLWAAEGGLGVSIPRDGAEALDWFGEMEDLHQASWGRRGYPGAFAEPFFGRFHRTLIGERFAHAEIQILRVTAGTAVLGILYNLVQGRRTYAYQSGFATVGDPRRKPGLVSHALAVDHNRMSGARLYDLMAGESQFKRSIAQRRDTLYWFVVRRDRLKYRCEEIVRFLKARCL